MLLWFSHFNPIKIKHLHNASFEKKLGEGSFGKVKIYKCKEKNCNGSICEQCFVVKKIKTCSLKRKIIYFLKNEKDYYNYLQVKAKKILLNEWEVGRNLDHINIIKTLDIDVEKMSLIFEYYNSIDLFYYISNINSPLFEYPIKTKNEYSIDIYKQILNGVKYLHDNNIVHLDIKLENIIINIDTRIIKIIDFGKAIKLEKENNQTSINKVHNSKSNWGTLQYLPPEYFSKSETVDLFKIDIWACGILLYNLIYNLSPWGIACIKRDMKYKSFVKFLNVGILSKEIFTELYHKAWDITNIYHIKKIFIDIFDQNYESRIDLDTTIERINQLKF